MSDVSDVKVSTLDAPSIVSNPMGDPRCKPYQPFGTCVDMFYNHDDQLMFVGPSGTGKSRGILEKMHLLMCKYPGARALMTRKTRASLTQTAMVTYEKFVLPQNDSVHFRTGEQEYRYVNGSTVGICGMDSPLKIMSSEYDFIYAQEAVELSEEDWETLTIRCRYGVIPYQQVVGDCNPAMPSHWIKRRIDRKEGMTGIVSRHEDNPVLYDQTTGLLTPRGEQYMNKLKALSGVRRKRYFEGIWAAAEGMIYTGWNPDIHVVNTFQVPSSWRRVWVIDFGYTNPFVWQCWAIDEEDRAYRIAEIYQQHLLVEDACALIKAWKGEHGESYPSDVICDWDAEDRATFERHMNMDTTPADKSVLNGLHSVMSRLRVQEDGKPKLFYVRDSVWEPDANLMEAMKPWKTEDEFDGYEWENSLKKETPRKVDDHGLDCTRYLSIYLDNNSDSWSVGMGR